MFLRARAQKDHQKALELAQVAIGLTEQSEVWHVRIAQTYNDMQRYEEAREEYRIASSFSQGNSYATEISAVSILSLQVQQKKQQDRKEKTLLTTHLGKREASSLATRETVYFSDRLDLAYRLIPGTDLELAWVRVFAPRNVMKQEYQLQAEKNLSALGTCAPLQGFLHLQIDAKGLFSIQEEKSVADGLLHTDLDCIARLIGAVPAVAPQGYGDILIRSSLID